MLLYVQLCISVSYEELAGVLVVSESAACESANKQSDTVQDMYAVCVFPMVLLVKGLLMYLSPPLCSREIL